MNVDQIPAAVAAKNDPSYYKKQWDYARKEAKRLLMQVECYRMQLQLAGNFWTWNGCKQQFYVESERFSNLVPKHVAEEVVAQDLYVGNEPRMV